MQTLAKHMHKVGVKPLFQSKVFDRPAWVSDQQEDIQNKIYGNPSDNKNLTRSTTDGAWFFVDKEGNQRFIVPLKHAASFVKAQHAALCHTSPIKLFNILKSSILLEKYV